MASGRLRLLQVLAAQLATIPSLGSIRLDPLGYQQIEDAELPALVVEFASQAGEVLDHPGRQMNAALLIQVTGYVKATLGLADGLTLAREGLYQSVENVLLAPSMTTRMMADIVANGPGADPPLYLASGPALDNGQAPPHGGFVAFFRASLKYERGSL